MNNPLDFSSKAIIRQGDTVYIKIGDFSHFILLTDDVLKLPVDDFFDFIIGEANQIIRQQVKMASDLVTTREACKRLKVAPATLRRWADTGKIDCVKTQGKHRRYLLTELIKFAQTETV